MSTTQTTDRIFIPCAKCQGTGHLPRHSNVAGGVCFSCTGSKGRWTTGAAIRRQEAAATARAAKAEAKRLERVAALDANWTAFAAAHTALATTMLGQGEAEVAATGYAGRVSEVIAYVRQGMAAAEAIARYNRYCK